MLTTGTWIFLLRHVTCSLIYMNIWLWFQICPIVLSFSFQLMEISEMKSSGRFLLHKITLVFLTLRAYVKLPTSIISQLQICLNKFPPAQQLLLLPVKHALPQGGQNYKSPKCTCCCCQHERGLARQIWGVMRGMERPTHIRKGETRAQPYNVESSVSKGFKHSPLDSDMWLLSMSCDHGKNNQSLNKEPSMHMLIHLCIMKQE